MRRELDRLQAFWHEYITDIYTIGFFRRLRVLGEVDKAEVL